MEEIVLVLTTVPEDFDADSLARELVEARHAACVSIMPPQTSIYRWKGAIETQQERQLLIKTVAGRTGGLWKAIRDRHPYEVPEILELRVSGGDPSYIKWLSESFDP
jgi:periplasmic divalent cation tolerance protein